MKESYEVVGGPSVEVSDLRISLADFVRDRLAIGFSLHQYSYSDPSARLTQNNFDLGLTFTPTPELGVALVGTNLAGEKESLPSDIRPTPRLSVGLNYIYRGFLRLRMDAETGRRMSTANPIIGLGYEAYINPFILFRFGHQSDNEQRAEFRSLGLGFDLPRFSMNYAYRSEVGGARKVSHLVDLAVPF
ncbi:MAG: hypothetical protein N2578_05375 [Bdellovibrionaceae bacterium]|nr:hypothetical protein [Pseudobdellovibrionaceae bacterium]